MTPSGEGNCAIDGQAVSCAAMQGLAGEGGGGETGTVIGSFLNAVALGNNRGWAIPSLENDGSPGGGLNWSFSSPCYQTAGGRSICSNGAIAEAMNLPSSLTPNTANNGTNCAPLTAGCFNVPTARQLSAYKLNKLSCAFMASGVQTGTNGVKAGGKAVSAGGEMSPGAH